MRGVWEEILDELATKERLRQGLVKTPSLCAIDSQSVKKVQFVSIETGIDGNKKINGRKRTILVDTSGLPFGINVTAANISDNQAGILAVNNVPTLMKIIGYQGYKTVFKEYVENTFNWIIEFGQRPESQQGFVPQKNRWQVERTFSWLNFKRRLNRDVEKTIEASKAMLEIAFSYIILKYLFISFISSYLF